MPVLPGKPVPGRIRKEPHIGDFEAKLTVLNRKGLQRGGKVVLEARGERTLWGELSEIDKKEGLDVHSTKLAEVDTLRRRINAELSGSTVPGEIRPKPGSINRISYPGVHVLVAPNKLVYGEEIEGKFRPIFESPIVRDRLGDGSWVGSARRLRSNAAARDVLTHLRGIYDPRGRKLARQLKRQVPEKTIRSLSRTVMSLDPETQDAFRTHVKTLVSSRDHAGDLLEAVSRHRSAVVSAILRNAAMDKSREHRGAVARIFAEADTTEAAYSELSSYKREYGL